MISLDLMETVLYFLYRINTKNIVENSEKYFRVH